MCSNSAALVAFPFFFKDTDEAVKCLYKPFEQDPTKSICKSVHYLTKIGYKPEESFFCCCLRVSLEM